MGRWTQYDEDSTRLPAGMTRVGYDSDTGRYCFRDRDGSLWEGPEGAEYGEMRRVGYAPVVTADHAPQDDDDEEAEIGVSSSRADGYRPLAVDDGTTQARHTTRTDSAYRVILPFFLIVAAVLLLVFRLVHSSTPMIPPETTRCSGANEAYTVVRGDTCWELSQTRGCTVQDILNANEGLKCEALRPGQAICLPPPRAT
ncbi:carbohydrate-binding module family 50 protein [Trametes sanguinea]|nr:carbohydrate-binding module family 50 protein [Trametes sanguinea]